LPQRTGAPGRTPILKTIAEKKSSFSETSFRQIETTCAPAADMAPALYEREVMRLPEFIHDRRTFSAPW
jgi:hypothetical protein